MRTKNRLSGLTEDGTARAPIRSSDPLSVSDIYVVERLYIGCHASGPGIWFVAHVSSPPDIGVKLRAANRHWLDKF